MRNATNNALVGRHRLHDFTDLHERTDYMVEPCFWERLLGDCPMTTERRRPPRSDAAGARPLQTPSCL